MWIKAQDGKLYNSNSFTTIEMKQNGSRFILQAIQVALGTHHINLQTCESEAEAQKVLDYLTKKLDVVDVAGGVAGDEEVEEGHNSRETAPSAPLEATSSPAKTQPAKPRISKASSRSKGH